MSRAPSNRKWFRTLGSPGSAASWVLAQAGLPAIEELGSTRWEGTAALTRRTRPIAADRLFLLGDATGYVEPFTGEGIAWALASGRAIAPLAFRAIERWNPHLCDEWDTLHRRLVRNRQLVCRGVMAMLHRPWLADLGFEVLVRLPRRRRARLRPSERDSPIPRGAMTMPATIAGIGTAVPPHRITQSDAAEIAKAYACQTPPQERLFQEIYRRSGVETRHGVVLDASNGDLARRQTFYRDANPTTRDRMRKFEEHAGDPGDRRGRQALEEAGIDSGSITHLVTVSCSGFCRAGLRHRPDQAPRAIGRCRAYARRFHGMPRPDQRPPGLRRLPRGRPVGVRAPLRGRIVQPPSPVRMELRADHRQRPLRATGPPPW